MTGLPGGSGDPLCKDRYAPIIIIVEPVTTNTCWYSTLRYGILRNVTYGLIGYVSFRYGTVRYVTVLPGTLRYYTVNYVKDAYDFLTLIVSK
jgi:hypothetical protein